MINASNVPHKLRDMEVWVDSQMMAGKTTEVTLPEFSSESETIYSGGMPFGHKIPTRQAPLDMTLKFSERNSYVITKYMTPLTKTHFVIRGYTESDGDAGSITINCRGQVMKSNLGVLKVDDDTDPLTIEVNLSFFQYLSNEVEICCIDNFNMINRWNGVDHMAKRRAALLR